MNALLLVLIYLYGFAFFLGYARGHDSGLDKASWLDAFGLALFWPGSLLWFFIRRLDGTSSRLLGLAFLLLAAAPAHATFTLTVSTAGPVTPSAVITSTPGGIVCPSTCTFAFPEGSTVTLGMVKPSTISFVGWAGTEGCRTNRSECLLTLEANSNVTAVFAPFLDLSFSGNAIGEVTISTSIGGTGVSCSSSGTCANGASLRSVLSLGTTVYLSYSTGTASSFVGWTDTAAGCSTASTCTVVMDGYRAVVATFTPAGTVGVSSFTIKVSLPRGGGTLTSSPAGISCPGTCSASFVSGGSVSFTTAAASGYRFGGWANGGCAGNNPCVVVSSTPLQGLGGKFSPAAYFYSVP